MLSSSSSSAGSGTGSSSSSSFITSSSSGGSLHAEGQLDSPKDDKNVETTHEKHHNLDADGIYPPYILLDEDGYEETVESIRMSSALSMPSTVNNCGASKNPSRPASPCRQTRISEILARIDQLLMGASQSHLAVSSHLGPSMQTQKHRHLVALVEQKIAPSCSEEERASLYDLVSSVDQAQSKWAHPERLGQAELYSSLEKVLNELRAFTPYSVPFSTRVSRKDVPDYYEVIKRPMDLGTMLRKLKAFVYNSKREFQADLQKIYNNCFTYNTDPNSQLRLHVTMLKDKWIRLMAEVPEIEIRIIAAATTRTLMESSNDSSVSLSTSASQVRVPDIHLDELLGYETDMPSEVSLAALPERTSLKMGVYHKARLKAQKRQKRRAKELFYPELVLPYQSFPDGWTISAKSRTTQASPSEGVEEILVNFEYWRRLRLNCSYLDDGDTVMSEPSDMKPSVPIIDSDASLPVLQRNIKSLIALMLVNIGFESVRSDALNMLKDLLLSKVSHLVDGLRRTFNTPQNTPPCVLANVRCALFSRDTREVQHLKLYATNFILGRRSRLDQALAKLSDFRTEQRERAYQMSLMEIDVVRMDGQSQDDLDGGDDLESVALDDEDLVLDRPAQTRGTDLDIFGIGDGTMNESTMTNELLALPKRSFDISSSGLEAGGLDPIQFIGEPPLRRLDED